MQVSRKLCKIMAIFALVVLATAAKADPIVGTVPLNVISYTLDVYAGAPTGLFRSSDCSRLRTRRTRSFRPLAHPEVE
jgi:hypothetical protein